MKRLNAYYIISIVTLAFMFLILMRTLQAIGWFDQDEGIDLASQFLRLSGSYLINPESTADVTTPVAISSVVLSNETWMKLSQGTTAIYQFRISDFEDDQLLVEIFQSDTSDILHKLEGCELLLFMDESNTWHGSTLGEFCYYNQELNSYLTLSFNGDKYGSTFIIETMNFDDQALISKQEFYLERIESNE
jgi:hypothetical protein